MGKIRVRILGFEKYNPKRSDQKTFTWFRLENRWAQSESLFGVPLDEVSVFLMLNGLAMEREALEDEFEPGEIEFDPGWFCQVWAAGRVSEELLMRTLRSLEGKTLTVTEGVPLPGTTCTQPVAPTSRYETNERDEHTTKRKRVRVKTDLPPEFESAYAAYPRKDGKSAGMKTLLRDTQPEEYPLLLRAVERYAQKIRDEKIEPRYVKHWSTFVGGWRDWLEPDAGSCPTPAQRRQYDFGEAS